MNSPGRRSICLFTAISLVCSQSSSICKSTSIWHTNEWTSDLDERKWSPGKNLLLPRRWWTNQPNMSWESTDNPKLLEKEVPSSCLEKGTWKRLGGQGLVHSAGSPAKKAIYLIAMRTWLWNQRDLTCHLPAVWHQKHYFTSLCLHSQYVKAGML